MTEENTLPKISLEEAKKRLDKTYDLCYVDYRDQLEDPKYHAEIVSTGWCDSLEMDWTGDQQYESASEIIKQEFEDVDTEDIEDDLRYEIYERDRSNPIKDLVNHTGKVVMYYDLDVEVNGYPADHEEEARLVAKALKIPYEQHEKGLKTLVANAGGGGKLVLMFGAQLSDFYGETKEKYVVIQDPEVCIMNRWEGSGYSQNGFGDFKVRFDRTRFKVDEAAPGYSFAGDVCGMIVEEKTLINTNAIKGVIGPKLPRELSEAEKREAANESHWRNTGKCSPGDMVPTRHKNTEYINNYPCGTRCKDCGTFWVD